jgi:glycerophosphoryl diester phosphodiesterase
MQHLKWFYLPSLVLLMSGIFLSCNKQEAYPEVQVYGHAGMGMHIPMSIYHDNSQEAIDLALSLPTIDGVELDVRLSKDSTLWLFHENTLEATTNGIGCIADLYDDEIAQLHYKSIHKEQLVVLDSVLPKLKDGHTFILDLKHWNACDSSTQLEAFRTALLKIPVQLRAQLILDSTNPSWLALLSEDFRVVFSTSSFETGLEQLQQIPQLHGLMMRHYEITEQEIQLLKNMGKAIFLFEMRSSKTQRAVLKKLPTGIIADDPRGALVIRD